MIGIVVASLLVLVAGLLSLWWARASWRGTLPQNWLFGYRTPLTLSDKDAWTTVNRAPAPFAAVGGIGASAAAVMALVLTLLGLSSIAPAFFGAGLGWLLLWTVLGIVPAHRAGRNYKRTRSSA
ncbi:SdpI family protein [Microbacterium testaceum]|jgi:hypothetical protein|uniref:SdpI family protein n=1 Tax=Microbacterium testaceum TaxID=2033 RepID=UPI0007344BCB|nr:SdpI family protein [Microbacterium testaceum]